MNREDNGAFSRQLLKAFQECDKALTIIDVGGAVKREQRVARDGMAEALIG